MLATEAGNPLLTAYIYLDSEAGTPMSDSDTPKSQAERSGGVNIDKVETMIVQGDVVGRDKTTGGSGGNEIPPSLPPQPPSSPAEPPNQEPWLPFQNRETELANLLKSLTNLGGSHFHLVLSGPKMGKTQLVEKLIQELQSPQASNWTIQWVDLYREPLDARIDANKLLTSFFSDENIGATKNRLENIAGAITRSGKSMLCIVDSAELLDEQTAARFREDLSRISAYIPQAGKNIWLALIIISRYGHRAWQGIIPEPRFDSMVLTNFTADVVEKALYNMAGRSRNWESTRYQSIAALLFQETEGLPALLARYMRWLDDRDFINAERIKEREQFDTLARPYVHDYILSTDSLLRAGGKDLVRSQCILERALLELSPFRLFTYKLLEEIVAKDHDLRGLMGEAKWAVDDLWQAIGDTYLMQPVDDPWRVMYPAVRRLLFRYQFVSESLQADAHLAADEFYEQQLNNLSQAGGKEQSVFVVEHLWHQAEYLRLYHDARAAHKLTNLAADLYGGRIQTDGYKRRELLDYIDKRMMNDDELQVSLSSIESGLLNRLLPSREQGGKP